MKIGVFDSGVGGLTIFKYLEEKLNNYDFVYLGDNLRTPYGGRSADTVYELTKNACDYLFKKENVNLIILACNTATASALKRLQAEYLPSLKDENKRILGIVRPIAEALPQISKRGQIGIIGTQGTIKSKLYDEEIAEQYKLQKENYKYQLYKKPAPLLVPLVEEGWFKHRATKIILRHYLRDFKRKHIDTLVLACTHYPLLYKTIQNIMGKQVLVLNPGPIVAESLKNYLERHKELEQLLDKNGQRKFLTTGDTSAFNALSSRFLGYSVKSEKIII